MGDEARRGWAAVAQMASGNDKGANLEVAAGLIAQAAERGAELVVLPENFAFMGETEAEKRVAAEDPQQGESLAFLRDTARQHRVWIVGGSLLLRSVDGRRATNTCFLVGADGEVKGRYDKIHLFDVTLEGGESYHESELIQPGREVVTVPTPFGRLGLTICYDLRFPELYRALTAQGATLLAVPSAFTQNTGADHWEVLLRARAIENFAYVLAAGQGGLHPGRRRTYGHSLIVEPWGLVVARAAATPSIALAEIDPAQAAARRRAIPCLEHRVL